MGHEFEGLKFTDEGKLEVDAEVSVSEVSLEAVTPISTHKSPNDFNATYTSATTITLTGLPQSISDDSQIAYIKVIPLSGVSYFLMNGSGGITIRQSSGVLTVSGGTTTLISGDVYEVGLNFQDKSYDDDLDIGKTIDQSPLWSRYTDAENLLSDPYELTSSFTDVGGEIDVRGYNYLTLWTTIDIGTSIDPQLRILHKHESGGAEEYREIYLGSPATNKTTINLNDYEIASDSDQLFKITLSVTGTHYIQIQAKDDADGDGQIDDLYVTKAWGA